MLPSWQTGTVTRIVQATHNTRRFWIVPSEPFDYKPGQFVTLDLPIHEQRNRRWRSYSIASAPAPNGELELLIVLLPGGAGTEYLFKEIKEGSELTLRGPHGLFVLPENFAEQELYLVCTGTGVAPFRAMAQALHGRDALQSPVHLIFGTRAKADLLYHEELTALEAAAPHFHYHPTLSREAWDGRKGYVHAVYEDLCRERPVAQFMLCGWRAMIDEARGKLTAMGYDKKALHYELYG